MMPMRSLALLLILVATVCDAAGDDSFRLEATPKDFAAYFPSYLANGYFSTMTSPRGTEANLAYMVALMDYAKDDVSRPAAVPGWSEIDYSTGKDSAGQNWLNASKLDASVLQDYRQTLDLYDATLTTRYRYVDGAKATKIEVTTFVSQDSPHLAASRLTLTPEFDGTIELKFPFRLWAPHQPRFAIAKLTGDEMLDAVAANNLSVTVPVNATTADRAPVWYHGDTHVVAQGGDGAALTAWLDGRAEQGLTMAAAEAIAVPDGVENVGKIDDAYKLGFALAMPVKKGKTYTFAKYAAYSREGWGGDAKADAELARAARTAGFDALLAKHQAAWHTLWKSDIVIDGDAAAQRAVHSDLYYLLSNSTVGTAWPMGACALTPNYAGHAFWDSDSWVFPALLLLHPERAKPIVEFRHRTMQPARERAQQYGAKGTMYPWESDPEKGIDQTPYFAYEVYREIHVNADIAIAQWQYWLASGDRAWLKASGWPVIREIAEYWVSRVAYNATLDKYEILHVTSPDEAYNNVPNDSFTNAAARKALEIATAAAREVGAKADPQWATIAKKMYIPFSDAEQRHLDFDASVPHDRTTWMGSSLTWLAYPNLDLDMPDAVRRNDFAFQLHELGVHGDDPNEMLMVMLAVHAAEIGDGAAAGRWIARNLTGFLKPPFNVRSETEANNAGYILSTSAGFLQSMIYGLTGLRMREQGLVPAFAPVLPPQWKSLTLRNVAFRGERFDIAVERDAKGTVHLERRRAR
jgi:trehalose/maltose hydrolase-like predicted phosphorylase